MSFFITLFFLLPPSFWQDPCFCSIIFFHVSSSSLQQPWFVPTLLVCTPNREHEYEMLKHPQLSILCYISLSSTISISLRAASERLYLFLPRPRPISLLPFSYTFLCYFHFSLLCHFVRLRMSLNGNLTTQYLWMALYCMCHGNCKRHTSLINIVSFI